MALSGGSLLPYVAGVLGAEFGLRASFAMTPVLLGVMLVVLHAALRRVRAAESKV
jgi:fucose permease